MFSPIPPINLCLVQPSKRTNGTLRRVGLVSVRRLIFMSGRGEKTDSTCRMMFVYSTLQWLLQLTTHEGREYLIQAPDQESRDEWKDSIEDCMRRLDPAKINRVMSPTRTIARSNTYVAISDDFR